MSLFTEHSLDRSVATPLVRPSRIGTKTLGILTCAGESVELLAFGTAADLQEPTCLPTGRAMLNKLFVGIFVGVVVLSGVFVWRVIVQHATLEQASTACVVGGAIGFVAGVAFALWAQ
jgi:hypothetical protein